MDKKYELTNESIVIDGHTLYRIKALTMSISMRQFSLAFASGDLGGFVESEANLSHDGDCWIFDDACVYGDACVYEDAWVDGDSHVFGKARVYGHARVYRESRIYGNARVHDTTWVTDSVNICENAHICGDAWVRNHTCICGDALVSGKAAVFGYTKIDHGVWTQAAIIIDNEHYLISSTLEKILVEPVWAKSMN